MKFCIFSLAGILSLIPFLSRAQSQEDTLLLKQGVVRLPDNGAYWLDSFVRNPPAHPAQILARFDELPSQEQRVAWERSGFALKDYLGDRTFTVLLQPELKVSVISASVRSVVATAGSWKINPALTVQGGGMVAVAVSWYDGVPEAELERHIVFCGGRITERSMHALGVVQVSVPADRITDLAGWYGIRYISPMAVDEPLNLESSHAAAINMAALSPLYGGPGLTGAGVTVGVGDNFSGLGHVDLNDRVVNFNPWPYQNHGVHINGIVGGAGIMDPKGRGMAPEVTLVDHLYSQVWMQTAAMKRSYGMTLTNNSYSATAGNCNYAGTYDVYSAALDRLSRSEPSVLHVFAAGNDGNSTCASFPRGFATVAGVYQAAKNVIVTASNTKWYAHVEGSSGGPAKDGRIKPEISAVGSDVYSTTKDDGYLTSGGTSMASPGVAGALALLTERYRQIFAGAAPRGDILKALILNGATDMGTPGPDFLFGFGVLNLYRSLLQLDENHYHTGSVSHLGNNSIRVTVPPNTAQLKVMLYWHDTSASPAAAKALVNDLDIEVSGPSGSRYLPLVPDARPGFVQQAATMRKDRINNAEQVVIDNPAPGDYFIWITGYEIPYGPQDYVVIWDFVPDGLAFTFPATGDSWPANDSLRIYWEAPPGTDPFILEYTTGNGNWTMISSNIPAEQRSYTWFTPAVSTNSCRFRLRRANTGQQAVSAALTINPQPVLYLSDTQCTGYMAVHWDAVPLAGSYEILRKEGTGLRAVDTVAATSYLFSGLVPDRDYYIAVRPFIQGSPGWRSLALKYRPDHGDCKGHISDGDLMMDSIAGPYTGRVNTSTQLSSQESFRAFIRNLDDEPVAGLDLSIRIDGGSWQPHAFPNSLPGLSRTLLTVSGFDFSTPGSYRIRAAVTNRATPDPVPGNDTVSYLVRQLRNEPVDLSSGYTETFEQEPAVSIGFSSMGITGNERWDFATGSDTGRLRFAVSDEMTISGYRSASMDARTNNAGVQNYLTGTFNLSDYDTLTHELRLGFEYKLHGIPKFAAGNEVWVRGDDRQPWIGLYRYDTLQDAGSVINSGSLSLTDALRAYGQDFSASFQVRFGQHDTGVIAANDFGNGLTLDNIRLYTVVNDMQLVRIVSPGTTGCAMDSSSVLTVLVRNGYNTPQFNVAIYYRLDSGAVYSAILPEIAPKAEVPFSFPQKTDLSAYGAHTLDVWLSAAGDTYSANDSIMGFVVRNQPLVSSFPYLESFEQGDGYWYAEGRNSSWQSGTPASRQIGRAASGKGAWKTGLEGRYSSSEHSFLYSPCFDLSGLTDPMLSFSLALDIEQCADEPCDAAFIEYSVNGADWQKLGKKDQGTNWYNTEQDVWSIPGFTRWHVASIPLPAADNVRLRFVFISDSGVELEGIAVDDIHIFDRRYPVHEGGDAGPVSATLVPGEWADIRFDGKYLAQLRPGSGAEGRMETEVYGHKPFYYEPASRYFFPSSFVLHPSGPAGDTCLTRLFISEKEFVSMITDTACPACSVPEDVYSMGITQYTDPDRSRENGSLEDNEAGAYTYFPSASFRWVPYNNGYYAELGLRSFSELWFHDGGPLDKFPLTDPAVELTADKIPRNKARVTWRSKVDTAVVRYELERAYSREAFSVIDTIPAHREAVAVYEYTDAPVVNIGDPVSYRVKYLLDNGKTYFSRSQKIYWTEPGRLLSLYPNPSRNGHFAIGWSSLPSGNMDVMVMDLAGRLLYSQRFESGAWNNVTMIRLSGLATGVYMVKVIIGGNRFERKLVVL